METLETPGVRRLPPEYDQQTVVRYALTYQPDKDVLRTLALGGRTYDTRELAEEALILWSGPEGLPRVFSPAEVASLQVRPCQCWRHHQRADGAWTGDPCGIYFDRVEGAPDGPMDYATQD